MFFMPPIISSLVPSDHSALPSPPPSASFLSSHRDVRSAAPGSGQGTSGCLVWLCLHCEVFSHIAAFHGPAWQITPPCVFLCVCLIGNTLYEALNTCELTIVCAHSWLHGCICVCALPLPPYAQLVCERVFTVLSCVCLERERCPWVVRTLSLAHRVTNEPSACLPSCFLNQQTFKGKSAGL